MPLNIFGVVNITEDSFSDGGLYLKSDEAIAQATKLHQQGANTLDLGPAASNPNAQMVNSTTQIERLKKPIQALKAAGFSLSVDSPDTLVQRFSLEQQVDYLNDIQGFANPGFYPELKASKAKLIVMHSVQRAQIATKVITEPSTLWRSLLKFFEQRLNQLVQAGIPQQRLILDPGMGFFLGSNPNSSFDVLKKLNILKQQFGLSLMISVSRKSFLRAQNNDAAQIQAATLSAEIFAATQGVDYIRTHDVRSLVSGLAIWDKLKP